MPNFKDAIMVGWEHNVAQERIGADQTRFATLVFAVDVWRMHFDVAHAS